MQYQPFLIAPLYKIHVLSHVKKVDAMKAKDLSGMQFGMWKVLNRFFYENRKKENAYWLCECTCGTKKPVRSSHLISGQTKSCGCLKEEDLTGRTFNSWYVVKKIQKPNPKEWKGGKYLCMCKCGVKRELLGSSISSGASKTCGCWQLKETKDTALQSLYSSTKNNAKRRNIDFNLSKDYFDLIIQEPCNYCGDETPQIFKVKKSKKTNKSRHFYYTGIDRVDSLKGYTKENIVSCCWKCNISKNILSLEEWKQHIKKICNHLRIT